MPSRWTSNTRLRRYTDADIPFMKALYRSTREQELRHMPFPPEQVEAFLEQQFRAQLTHYAGHYRCECFDIVEVSAQPAGRLFVDYGPTETRVVDITLAPVFRGQGLGEFLLKQVIARSQTLGAPVTMHVERGNPALRLYRRLGFCPPNDHGQIYLLLQHDSDHAQREGAARSAG